MQGNAFSKYHGGEGAPRRLNFLKPIPSHHLVEINVHPFAWMFQPCNLFYSTRDTSVIRLKHLRAIMTLIINGSTGISGMKTQISYQKRESLLDLLFCLKAH